MCENSNHLLAGPGGSIPVQAFESFSYLPYRPNEVYSTTLVVIHQVTVRQKKDNFIRNSLAVIPSKILNMILRQITNFFELLRNAYAYFKA